MRVFEEVRIGALTDADLLSRRELEEIEIDQFSTELNTLGVSSHSSLAREINKKTSRDSERPLFIDIKGTRYEICFATERKIYAVPIYRGERGKPIYLGKNYEEVRHKLNKLKKGRNTDLQEKAEEVIVRLANRLIGLEDSF